MKVKPATNPLSNSPSSTDKSPPRQKAIRLYGGLTEVTQQFDNFVNVHDVIDWNITQESHSMTWSIIIRYKG